MTRDEFQARFRGRFLLFLTEAWAARKQSQEHLGMLIDEHALRLKQLLNDAYDALQPPAPKPPAANGQPAQPAKKIP